MDWIDPRYKKVTKGTPPTGRGKKRGSKRKRTKIKRGKPLSVQVNAALAQPLDVWSVAFDHSLAKLKWPHGVSAESTLLWSVLMQEQAEVLVRTGMSAKKLSAIVGERTATTEEERIEQVSEVVGLMNQPLESLAFEWLDDADVHAHAALAVAALAWQLPDHARRSGNGWLTQWLQVALDRVEKYSPDLDEPVICHLVLQCELPLLIGVATSVSKRTVLSEAGKAMDNLAEYLERSEVSVSPWLAHGATYLRASLASVLRCRVLANSLGLRQWFPPQQKAVARLLKHAARWCRPDGSQLLAAGNNAPRSKSIWEALARQTKNRNALANAMTLSGIGTGKLRQARKNANPNKLPALTHFDEDAACVCMQSDWRKKGPRIALDFSDTEICIEALGTKGKPILVGDWTARVEHDGQAQLQLDQWQELCWFSDEDVDYLEMEASFGQHARVQRQVVLFRQARMLLMADALLCETDGQWGFRAELPLAAGAKFKAAKKTCEGFIETSSGLHALVLPLFLPEWRRQLTGTDSDRFGSLECVGENLVAKSHSPAQRLYLPTLINLGHSHPKQQFTWRHLTVCEELRVVDRSEAAAYRVQIDGDQWAIYRSLAPTVRRTALGMHTLADFYAGHFDSEDGEVATIVEVEA